MDGEKLIFFLLGQNYQTYFRIGRQIDGRWDTK